MAFFWLKANGANTYHTVTGADSLSAYGNTFGVRSVARTNNPIPAGKWYWELSAVTDNNHGPAPGISTLSASDWQNDTAGAYFLNSSNNGFSWRYWNPGNDPTGNPGIEDSDVVGVAFDTVTRKLWFSIGGVWLNSGDPAAGTGEMEVVAAGTYYPSAGFEGSNSSNDISTANFGATATTYAPPSGFSTLDPLNMDSYELALNLSYALQTVLPVEQAVNLSYSQVSIQPHEQVVNLAYQVEADAVWTPVVTAIHYTLKLVADGFSDLILPMSSFQSRLRQSTPSYLQVIVPAALNFVDDINDRSAGDIVIERGLRWTDGTIQTTEIARVNFETLRIDQGATNDSATLTGHKTTTNSAPKTVSLQGAQTRSLSGSSIRYRCEIDNSLRPGDTANINNESFVVNAITYVVSPVEAYMEISNGG